MRMDRLGQRTESVMRIAIPGLGQVLPEHPGILEDRHELAKLPDDRALHDELHGYRGQYDRFSEKNRRLDQ